MKAQTAASGFVRSQIFTLTFVCLTTILCRSQKQGPIELKTMALSHISQIEQEGFIPEHISATVDFFESIPELKSKIPAELRIDQMGYAGIRYKRTYIEKYAPQWKEWLQKRFEKLCYSRFEIQSQALNGLSAEFHPGARFYLKNSVEQCDVCSLNSAELRINGCN